MQNTEIVKLSWKQFGQIISRMEKEIHASFNLNVIVGVGKSGIIPAAILAKRLGIIEVYSIVVSLYNEEKPPQRLYQGPQIMFSNLGSLEDKKVLVVDDFVHTGATLKKVLQKVSNVGAEEVRSAVVGLRLNASYSPDYCGMTFKGCIWFPWDSSFHKNLEK